MYMNIYNILHIPIYIFTIGDISIKSVISWLLSDKNNENDKNKNEKNENIEEFSSSLINEDSDGLGIKDLSRLTGIYLCISMCLHI